MKPCLMFPSTALLFLIIIPSILAVSTLQQKEHDILNKILDPSQYDKRIRPSGGNGTGDGPVIVRVNMYYRKVDYVDDMKMEYRIQVTCRQRWTDDRLVFDDAGGKIKYLTLTETDQVWVPDLFFTNEKSGHFHNIIAPNQYLRISHDGSVLYSKRITLTLSCPMDLKSYPMDQQECQLQLASYGHTTGDLVLLWVDNNPVQITKNVYLHGFSLDWSNLPLPTDYCNSKTNTGEYSCLVVKLTLNRDFSYHFFTIYIPFTMMVIVSYVSFWLDRNALSSRITLTVITLYMMSWMATGINQKSPPVSYTKAIDVWTGTCVTFGFGALLEVVLVNYFSQLNPSALSNEEMPKAPPQHDKIIKMIEFISRITYPLAFLLFNIVYWPSYMT